MDCFVNFYEEFEELDSRFMVCEYCSGGTLEAYIESHKRKINIDECRNIIFEIAIGVYFLHKNGMTHRDLKGDNILIHNGKYKIADFGFSIDDSVMQSMLGTPLYMAPEIIERPGEAYTNKVDVWSLAVILYNLLTKEFPFYSSHRMKLYQKIINTKFMIPKRFEKKWSTDLKNLLLQCFQKNAKLRLSIKEFINHPALQDIRRKHNYIIETIESDFAKNGSLTRQTL
jgi:serine/threonine protein kinase